MRGITTTMRTMRITRAGMARVEPRFLIFAARKIR